MGLEGAYPLEYRHLFEEIPSLGKRDVALLTRFVDVDEVDLAYESLNGELKNRKSGRITRFTDGATQGLNQLA